MAPSPSKVDAGTSSSCGPHKSVTRPHSPSERCTASPVPSVDIEEEKLQTDHPPDGGYGWVIVLASFLANALTNGMDVADGLVYLHFLDRYGASAQLTAWTVTMVSTIRLCLGPLAGAISARYSCRACSMLGTVVVAVSFLLTGGAGSLVAIIFSFSLLQGLGRGLIFTPMFLCVTMYFDKRRGLAAGISGAGTGLGTFVVVPLVNFLFENFGFDGAFYLMAALGTHFFIFSMLYRPLGLHYRISRAITFRLKRLNGNGDDLEDLTSVEGKQSGDSNGGKLTFQFGDKSHTKNNSPDTKMERFSQVENEDIVIHRKPVLLSECGPDDFKEDITTCFSPLQGSGAGAVCDSTGKQLCNLVKVNDCKEEHESQILIVHTSSASQGCVSCLKSKWLSLWTTILPVDTANTKAAGRTRLFNFSLLRNKSFLFYCINIFFYSMVYRVGLIFIPALLEANGLTRGQAAIIMAVSGVVDTISRIVFGILFDRPLVRPIRPALYNGFQVLLGLSMFILPSLTSFSVLTATVSMFIMGSSVYGCQRAVIVIDLVGVEHTASGFGILLVFQGLGMFVGPFLAGLLKDELGDYSWAFYMCGIVTLMGLGTMAVSNVFFFAQTRKREQLADREYHSEE